MVNDCLPLRTRQWSAADHHMPRIPNPAINSQQRLNTIEEMRVVHVIGGLPPYPPPVDVATQPPPERVGVPSGHPSPTAEPHRARGHKYIANPSNNQCNPSHINTTQTISVASTPGHKVCFMLHSNQTRTEPLSRCGPFWSAATEAQSQKLQSDSTCHSLTVLCRHHATVPKSLL